MYVCTQNFTLEIRHAQSHKLLMTLSNGTAPSFSVNSGWKGNEENRYTNLRWAKGCVDLS